MLELLQQHRNTLGAAFAMADRIVDRHLFRLAAVLEEHLQRITYIALGRIEIVLGELRIFLDRHLVAQRVDAWIGGDIIAVIVGGQTAEDQRHGDHVLDAVIAVGVIRQRPGFVDDAHTGFLGFDFNPVDLIELGSHLRMQLNRALDGRLRVEFGRIRNLEQNVLHHVGAERTLELEWLALERDVVEAPGFRRQRRRITDAALDRVECMRHRAPAGVARRPALARAGIRRVAIRAQGAVVDPAMR